MANSVCALLDLERTNGRRNRAAMKYHSISKPPDFAASVHGLVQVSR
jgi:hypothetical protein